MKRVVVLSGRPGPMPPTGPGFEVVAQPATVGIPQVVAGLLREAGA
jgi:hypothetical protein